MVNIADVAKAAGVSRSTVSYALSGNRPISQETRSRIDAAIAELGFTVNAGARALATAQTMVLGLLLQFMTTSSPGHAAVHPRCVDGARELGYDILMVTDDHGPDAVRRITSSNMVDGVVLLDVAHDDPRLPPLRAARQPGALVGLPKDTEGVDVFDLDFGEAARQLVDHLHGLGHRDLIWSPRPGTSSIAAARTAGASATPLWNAPRDTVCRCTCITANPSSRHRTQSERHPRRPAAGDGPDRAQRRIDRGAPRRVARARDRRPARPVGGEPLLPRFRTHLPLPYTAVETSPDRLGRKAVQHWFGESLIRTTGHPSFASSSRSSPTGGAPPEKAFSASCSSPRVEPVQRVTCSNDNAVTFREESQ